jgi:hypothetical protein
VVGQPERAQAEPEETIELIDVGAVLVGDEHAEAVVGEPDALGVEAAILRLPELRLASKLSERPEKKCWRSC